MCFAIREFKNREGEMTNYKYAELFAANVHERRSDTIESLSSSSPTWT